MPEAPTDIGPGLELARLAAETGLRITVSLPARHLEMEPDRAPVVQLHYHDLAGPAPDDPAHHIDLISATSPGFALTGLVGGTGSAKMPSW